MTLRDATPDDLPVINEIYNHYVLTSTCTYQVTPATLEERTQWFAGRNPRHPVVVAEENGQVLAWGSLSPFHKREAYAATVENSVYVSHRHQRRGLGSALMEELLRRARETGARSVVAIVSADQDGSIALHEKLGFSRCGRLRQAGEKFGRTLDVIYLQLLL